MTISSLVFTWGDEDVDRKAYGIRTNGRSFVDARFGADRANARGSSEVCPATALLAGVFVRRSHAGIG
jgi:hypothetical protein